MVTEWNLFVKKVYHEGKHKSKNYSFKQALKDASRRKKEMHSSSHHKKPKSRRTRKSRK